MKVWSKPLTVLNTLAIALGISYSAIALDPETLYRRASPAVVSIFASNGKSSSFGSGFITNSQGAIVTNNHVVAKTQQVRVQLADGSVYPGIVVSRRPDLDLAVVQIRPKRSLPILRLRRIPPRIGQKAYAIGNPRGLTRTFSDGIVSRIDEIGLIQYTAASSPGSSGGPLLDEDGNVIGVVTLSRGNNLNFAVPIAAVDFLPGQQGSVEEQQIRGLLLGSALQFRRGNYQRMLKILNEGIQRYPNNASLYLNRGVARSSLKDFQGALSDYARSIQLKPSSLAYSNQARIYLTLKQQQPALRAFTEAIKMNRDWGESNLGEVFYNRGRLQAQLGNKKAAIADFQQAAKFYYERGNVERYRAALDQITLISTQ